MPDASGELTVAVIGGSGLYAMEGLEVVREHQIQTPFGAPSDLLLEGRLNGAPVVFMARHGRHHHLLPTEVPYRANIWALRSLGVRYPRGLLRGGVPEGVHWRAGCGGALINSSTAP